MLKLIGTDGSRFYNWPMEIGKYTIGRGDDTDLTIDHKTVSRHHATIDIETSKQFYIEDLNSRNGTLVNGEVITGRVTIKEGDTLMFGQVEFKLSAGDKFSNHKQSQTTRLSEIDPEKSVFLSINEALKPLPTQITELPNVLPTLFDMAKILVLPEPKEVMLDKALQMISKVIPAERLAILSTSKNNEVTTTASILPSGKDPGTFQLSRTIVNEILTEKNSILIDPQDDPRFASKESIILSEIKSAMIVPLFDEGKVLGLLYVDTTNPAHRYNDDYLRLLATFGNLVASRLLNYELMNERQEKQVFEAELRRASMIQRNLLIKSSPNFDGYQIHSFQEQCRRVGGDLFDVCCLDDGRLLYVVADVSGKGMGGALLMSNILASLRILYNDSDFNLSKVVRQVSLQLHKYSAAEDFATLFIGLIDPESNKMSFINAGHNPPLLLRKDGKLEFLEPSGTMIGAFNFSDWTEDATVLNSGDILLVFTDGIVEADHDGVLYSDERLEELMKKCGDKSAQELVDIVMKDVLEFAQDSPRSDDITMVAIKKE